MAKSGVAEPEVDVIKALEKRVADLEEREARHWKKTENHLARWGTYYDSAGIGSPFLVDKLITAGANGVALSSRQGLVEHVGLPMRLTPPPSGENVGPCWVPEIVPERTKEETLELFDSDGADTKAST